MAKKTENTNMVERFDEFKEYKHIDKATMISVLEESFRSVLKKEFGTDENLDVIMNPDKGDVQIFQNLEVVADGEVQNPNLQISLSDARADNDPDAEVGEEHTKEIVFADFGRRAILNLRQTLQAKILDLQKEAIYTKFKELEGELVTAEVYQTWSKEILLMDDDKNELLLPKSECIPGDFFRKGEMVRVVIAKVDNKNNNPKITVSRVNEQFLRALFELEVPEIHDGLINIRAVARIPGERAKIAVESYDDRIDPVGACVGVKGSRIHGIVRELRNENIDVIPWTNNISLLIQRALSPAKVSSIRIDEDKKLAEVFLSPDQVSLAIGRNGANIKLANSLTGFEIDVYRETENYVDDVVLDEFAPKEGESNEATIDQWVIDALKNMGLKTARAVLETPKEILIDQADLEAETVDHVMEVLREEFYDENEEDADEEALIDEAEAESAEADDEVEPNI